MKKDLIISSSLRELSLVDMFLINGGEPTSKTSFWYDVFYFASRGVGNAVQYLRGGWIDVGDPEAFVDKIM